MINLQVEGRDPFELFTEWMNEAKKTPQIREPIAMALATVSKNHEPHTRIVLCKEWGPKGFVFYTNYLSLKGHDLDENSNASAVFYWDPLFRQVRVDGVIRKTSREQSETYWKSRAKHSQISQYISRQSEKVGSREELEQLWKKAEEQFAFKEIPCPAHWGGYALEAKTIEFWIGRADRLHDRFRFEKSPKTWTILRLYP